MSSSYGENLRLTIFGQSHSPAIGMTLEGLPAGVEIDMEKLRAFLARRAPGQNAWSTARREADLPEFLSGLRGNVTCGAPLTAIIRNTDTRSGDYAPFAATPRPGHADYTASVKYHGFQDPAGGGHFSGRLTAPLCIAGGVCLQILEGLGIRVISRIAMIGGIDGPAVDIANITEDAIRAEVRRAIDTYCPAGRFYPSIPNGRCFREWNNAIAQDEMKRYGAAWAQAHPILPGTDRPSGC